MTRFDTVLVANRGEIALRVMRACVASGLRSVAVYSDADRDAPHVRAADAAVRIGPGAAADSYLSIPALIEAAERTRAGAVHPGYGFLSERAEFARAVVEAGLVFVGPSADVMDAMGRKDKARAIATAAGVPVVPAADAAADDLDSIGRQVGFPLLVKAASGGGGKGMRIVRSAPDLDQAVAAARREALSAFGDDTMLFERYVENGRHIEVQVLGDEHGHLVHLFERDCSVQRRHQKVIEEAPASVISPAVRDLVLSSSIALAGEVDYVGAGTVEFLVRGDEAYFLEMNTRLQVEHPVTEIVTGLDLVALQLAVAQGEPLPFGQADVCVRGHAIEARVYAEDPAHGFVPQAGVARLVHWPERARVDAALGSGQRVSTHYDPMLGKVIVSGATREAARLRLVQALDDTAIVGLTTNAGFLRQLADSDAYRDSQIDTAWLDHHPGAAAVVVPDQAWWIAACAVAAGNDSTDPLATPDGWRLAGPRARVPVSLSCIQDASTLTRVLLVDSGAGVVQDGERQISLRWTSAVGVGEVRCEVDGVAARAHVVVAGSEVAVAYQGQTHVFELPDAFAASHRLETGDGTITAPMPGTVLAVMVGTGAEVAEGETLAVVEAMKMELALKAPFAGVVTEVSAAAKVGGQVDLGAALFVVTADAVAAGQDGQLPASARVDR